MAKPHDVPVATLASSAASHAPTAPSPERVRRIAERIPPLPSLAADLTYVGVNGGVAYANSACWENTDPPAVGMNIQAAGGNSTRIEGTITELWADGTIVIQLRA